MAGTFTIYEPDKIQSLLSETVRVSFHSGDYPKDGSPTLTNYDPEFVTVLDASDLSWPSHRIEAIFVGDDLVIDPETNAPMTRERLAELGFDLAPEDVSDV